MSLKRIPSTALLENLTVFVFLSVVICYFSRLGVDPHHDGVMLQPALVIADGGTIHRDVFEQYGPVTAWIQGLMVKIAGKTLISIKIGTGIVLATGITFFFSAWRFWKGAIDAYIGLLIALSLAYFFTPGLVMHPWSSDVLIFVQGITMWLVIRHMDRHEAFVLAAIGCLTTIAIFTRLTPGIAQLLLISGILIRRRRALKLYLLGFSLAALLVLGYLTISGAINAWWYQTIMFPKLWVTDTLKSSPVDFLLGVTVHKFIPVLAGPLALIYLVRLQEKRELWLLHMIPVILLVAWWCRPIIHRQLPEFWGRTDFTWVIAGVVLLQGLRTVTWPALQRQTILKDSCALAIPISALVQIYPVMEARHLWWSTLPACGLLWSLLTYVLIRRMQRVLVAVLLLVPMSINTFLDARHVVRSPREKVQGLDALRGMYFDKAYSRYFDDNFRSLAAYLEAHPKTPILNYCADGLFASLSQQSRMPDAYFVLWNFPGANISDERRRAWSNIVRPMLWMCPPSPEDHAQASVFGMRVVPVSSETAQLPRRDQWPFKGTLAVPNEWPVAPGATG